MLSSNGNTNHGYCYRTYPNQVNLNLIPLGNCVYKSTGPFWHLLAWLQSNSCLRLLAISSAWLQSNFSTVYLISCLFMCGFWPSAKVQYIRCHLWVRIFYEIALLNLNQKFDYQIHSTFHLSLYTLVVFKMHSDPN